MELSIFGRFGVGWRQLDSGVGARWRFFPPGIGGSDLVTKCSLPVSSVTARWCRHTAWVGRIAARNCSLGLNRAPCALTLIRISGRRTRESGWIDASVPSALRFAHRQLEARIGRSSPDGAVAVRPPQTLEGRKAATPGVGGEHALYSLALWSGTSSLRRLGRNWARLPVI